MKRPCHARRLDTRGILWKGFSKRSGRASVSWSALSLYFIKIPLSTTGYGRDPIPWWRVERKSLEIRQKRMRLFLKTRGEEGELQKLKGRCGLANQYLRSSWELLMEILNPKCLCACLFCLISICFLLSVLKP